MRSHAFLKNTLKAALFAVAFTACSKGSGDIGGTYLFGGEGPSGTVDVYPLTDSSALFYLELSLGAPSYNSGAIDGQMEIKGSVGTYILKDEDFDCILNFKFSSQKLDITTESGHDNCGFGGNVYADNTYKQTSASIPQYYVNGQGDTVFFKSIIKGAYVSTPAKTETAAIENDAGEEEQSDWPEPEEIPPGTVITVSTAREFMQALGSDRVIELKPGKYNLSELSPKSKAERVPLKYNNKVTWVKEHDGYEIELTEIRNLTIRSADGADGGNMPELIVDPRYAYVLRFVNSSDIAIDGIKAGHSEAGSCSGGVFAFVESARITINNTAMYGSGTEGLTLTNVSNMKVTNSRIYECTYAIMTVVGGKDIAFEKCEFDSNQEFELISVSGTKNLSFTDCKFKNNTGRRMFYVLEANVSVSHSVFSGNKTQVPIASSNNVTFSACELEGEFIDESYDNND